jgi:hypothetical protein
MTTKRALMLAIAAAAVIAALLIIVLTGGGNGKGHRASNASGARRPTVVQAAASYLHLPASEVRQRLRAGQTLGQIAATKSGASRAGLIDSLYTTKAAAIKARKLSPAQERTELQQLRHELTSQVDRARRAHGRALRLASRYLGIGEATLSQRLGSGSTTLAQLATATPGHTKAGLIGALVEPQRTLLERALRQHQISATQERRQLARIERRTAREVTRPGG